MVCVMRADMPDDLIPLFQFCFISSFNGIFPGGHHAVGLHDCFGPGFFCDSRKSFIIISGEFWHRLTQKLRKIFLIPENDMVSKLSDRMITIFWSPIGLLGSYSFNGHIQRRKPLFFIMGGF